MDKVMARDGSPAVESVGTFEQSRLMTNAGQAQKAKQGVPSAGSAQYWAHREKRKNSSGEKPLQPVKGSERNGAPGEIRTPDLTPRRRSLYPAELRAHSAIIAYIR